MFTYGSPYEDAQQLLAKLKLTPKVLLGRLPTKEQCIRLGNAMLREV